MKDALVFVGNLVFPCDVVMEISLKRGKLTLEVGEEKMVFEL